MVLAIVVKGNEKVDKLKWFLVIVGSWTGIFSGIGIYHWVDEHFLYKFNPFEITGFLFLTFILVVYISGTFFGLSVYLLFTRLEKVQSDNKMDIRSICLCLIVISSIWISVISALVITGLMSYLKFFTYYMPSKWEDYIFNLVWVITGTFLGGIFGKISYKLGEKYYLKRNIT